MSTDLKQTLLADWNPMRILQLVLALIILEQAILYHDAALGLFGGLFMLMAVFNTGCCGSSCGVGAVGPTDSKATIETTPVEFEEIKNKN